MNIFALFLSGIVLSYVFPFFPVTAGILLAASAFLLVVKRRYPFILVLILGFAYAFLRYSPPADHAALCNRDVIVECLAESSPRELAGGRFVNEVLVASAADAGTGIPLAVFQGLKMHIVSEGGLPRHLRYILAAKTAREGERHNPGAMKNDGLYATLVGVGEAEPVKGNPVRRWLQDRRDSLNHFFGNSFEGDSGALLASLTIGERSTMSEEVKDAFNSTGLAHLLSISGTHFGLFSALIFGLFRFIIRSLPHRVLQGFTVYLSPSQAAALFSLPFMLFYLLLSGTSIPALRSFLMINIFLLGLLIGRKGFWLNSLLFAAFIICVGDPSALLSISFQLSFLAVFCIGLFLIEGEERPKGQGFPGRMLTFLKSSVLLSLSASLGTAPLVAYYFHYFSIISPLANFFITPFIGFLLVPLSLIASFIFIFSGHYPFAALAAFLSDTALKGVKLLAAVPFADIKVPAFPLIVVVIFYAGLTVYFLSGKKRHALALPLLSVLLCLVFLMQGRNTLSVTYLDVGQGDSAVIEGYNGKTIAIDTGRTGRELEGYLRYLGKGTIDVLVITHADEDHAGGGPFVMQKFPVREVWDNGLIAYPDDLMKNTVHRSLERGDETDTGGLRVQVLHPYREFYTFEDDEATAENNDSLVMKVTGQNSFLFTADTAREAEEDMLALGPWLKSDVIKVSHHGSRTSSGEDFLNAVSPGIGVISVGRDNRYGHPHRETLERFNGVKICRTDMDGAVKITETPEGLRVKTYREFIFERTRSAGGEWRNLKRLFMRW